MVTAVSGRTLRTRLQGIYPTDSQDQTTTSPAPNPHEDEYPVRTPYTNSSYSRAEEPEPVTFPTNGVQYMNQASGSRPENTASSHTESQPWHLAPSRIRFCSPSSSDSEIAATPLNLDGAPDLASQSEAPNPPWGNCPFPHVQTKEYIENPAPVAEPDPTPMPVPRAKSHHRPLWAVSSCCLARRTHSPPATTHSEDDQISIKTERDSSFDEPHDHHNTMGTCCSELHHSSVDSSLKNLGETTISGSTLR